MEQKQTAFAVLKRSGQPHMILLAGESRYRPALFATKDEAIDFRTAAQAEFAKDGIRKYMGIEKVTPYEASDIITGSAK